MKFRKDRKTEAQESNSGVYFPKRAPRRWWDTVLVGIAMTAMFVTIILKLTGLLPNWL